MNPLTISIVIAPPPVGVVGIHGDARKAYSIELFANALGNAITETVKIIEAPVVALPREGIRLLYSGGWDSIDGAPEKKKIAERLFLMSLSRHYLPDLLQDDGFAGAVESTSYISWCNNPADQFGGYIYGRRDVAERMSAKIAPPPFSGNTYCQFSLPGANGLPAAVAQYLVAYWKTIDDT